jgi:hypothetical protein
VNAIEAENVNVHAILVKLASGQLPFPGSCGVMADVGVPPMIRSNFEEKAGHAQRKLSDSHGVQVHP